MIILAGIQMPESAVWINEMAQKGSKAVHTSCIEGSDLVFQSTAPLEIDIYIPKISGELTRETVQQIRSLAETGGAFYLNINGAEKKAVFRYADGMFDLRPLQPRQQQTDTDSYYGTIRLLEV